MKKSCKPKIRPNDRCKPDRVIRLILKFHAEWQENKIAVKRLLRHINQKLEKLMTKEEFEQKQDELTAQLNKALAEILAAIQNSGTVPQEMVDKLQAAKDLAQQLDDLNPDQP